MLLTFRCTQCRSKLEIDAREAGTRVDCPRCGTRVAVPNRFIGPGATIGGFRLIELIGRGGMGEVYRARQVALDRDVALKILQPHIASQQNLVDRFLREARMAARIEHPHVVTAYAAGEDDGVYYMAMAFARGETLAEKLSRQGTMAEDDALRIIRKLAAALGHVWREHRILHRDIKPANIMIDPFGEPKLLDLGLSKSLLDGHLTLVKMSMGTPNYTSPEQGAGERDLDFRSDLYALGAMLYHMLTGRIPFAGKGITETLRKQAEGFLTDPREIHPQVSDGCALLLHAMLARKPSDRPASYEVLIEQLDRVRRGLPPAVRPLPASASTLRLSGAGAPKPSAEAPQAVRPSALRDQRPFLLLALGILATTILLLATAHHIIRNHAPKPEPPPPAPPPAATETPAAAPREPPHIEAPPARGRTPPPLPPRTHPPPRHEERPPAPALYGPDFPAPIREARERFELLLAEVADHLLQGNVVEAGLLIRGARAHPDFDPVQSELQALGAELLAILRLPDVVMRSFAADQGVELPIQLQRGIETAVVRSVNGRSLNVRRILRRDGLEMGTIERTIAYDELSPREKALRLGFDINPETDLMRGFIALELRDPTRASMLFQRADTPLSRALAARMAGPSPAAEPPAVESPVVGPEVGGWGVQPLSTPSRPPLY